MADVAREAGVSVSTVSRALANHPRVRASTKQLVELAVKRLGYEADPVLSALVKRRWQGDHKRSSRHVALLYQGSLKRDFRESILKQADKNSIILSEFNLLNFKDNRHLVRLLKARGVEGIIICVTGPVHDWAIPWDDFYCLAIGAVHSPFTQIVTDYFSAVHTAVSRVLAYGYRRLGFIQLYHNNPAIDIRQTACFYYHRCQVAETSDYTPSILRLNSRHSGKLSTEESVHLVRDWYDEHKPDAIIDATFTALGNLRSTGVRFPEDCGYVTLFLHNNDEAGEIAAIDEKMGLQGKWAIEMISSIMLSGARGIPASPPRLVTPCGWFDGKTLPRINQHS